MRAAHRIAGPAIRRRLRARVTGLEQVPTTGGVLLAANHVSNLDNYLLAACCPRPVHFLGKAELARGLFGRFNLALGMVPVARGVGDVHALDALVELLTDGRVVALFPEGTRSPTGQLHRFRSGLARVAAQAAAPVIPVGIRGTTVVWPRGRRPQLARPAPGAVEVRFGAPIPPPRLDAKDRRRFTAEARTAVAALSGQSLEQRFTPIEHAGPHGDAGPRGESGPSGESGP